jgi:hypothetical protein
MAVISALPHGPAHRTHRIGGQAKDSGMKSVHLSVLFLRLFLLRISGGWQKKKKKELPPVPGPS